MPRQTFTHLLVACASFIGAMTTAAPSAASPLAISFDTTSVVVSGVTPGGKAILFAVSRELTPRRPASAQIVRRAEVLSDAAHAGAVTLNLGKPVPSVAIWAAIDLTSGSYVVTASPGDSATALAVSDLVKNDNAGQLKKLDWPASEMEAVLVRPGEGAWRLTAAKYSKLYEHGAPGGPIRTDIEKMIPVGDSGPAPKTFKQRDVIVLMDPRWMQYAVVEVGK